MSQGRPWHLWVVGILCLLFGGMGAFDWVMTMTRNEAYLSALPQETLDFYFSFPVWMFVLWAIGNFGGLIGALLLLMKKSLAVPFLAASLVAGIITTVNTYAFAEGLKFTGTAGLVTSLVFLTIAALVLVYARKMTAKGVLT